MTKPNLDEQLIAAKARAYEAIREVEKAQNTLNQANQIVGQIEEEISKKESQSD